MREQAHSLPSRSLCPPSKEESETRSSDVSGAGSIGCALLIFVTLASGARRKRRKRPSEAHPAIRIADTRDKGGESNGRLLSLPVCLRFPRPCPCLCVSLDGRHDDAPESIGLAWLSIIRGSILSLSPSARNRACSLPKLMGSRFQMARINLTQ